MSGYNYYIIGVNKVVDDNGRKLTNERFEFAQYDVEAPQSFKAAWGHESNALHFKSEEEATSWFEKHKKELRNNPVDSHAQYDWNTLSIRHISFNYIPMTVEDDEPETLTMEDAKMILIEKKKHADDFDAAAGFDEGYYSGMADAYEYALEILNKIK